MIHSACSDPAQYGAALSIPEHISLTSESGFVLFILGYSALYIFNAGIAAYTDAISTIRNSMGSLPSADSLPLWLETAVSQLHQLERAMATGQVILVSVSLSSDSRPSRISFSQETRPRPCSFQSRITIPIVIGFVPTCPIVLRPEDQVALEKRNESLRSYDKRTGSIKFGEYLYSIPLPHARGLLRYLQSHLLRIQASLPPCIWFSDF